MTERLDRITKAALKLAKDDLTHHGSVAPTLTMEMADGNLEVIRFEGKSGRLFNSGAVKDVFFDVIRHAVREKQISAVVFAAEAWMAKSTPKGDALPHEEFRRRTGERGFEQALKDGLVTRREIINVTAQCPEETVITAQFFTRDGEGVTFDECTVSELRPDQFYGRQKMYGDLKAENIR